MRQFHLGRKKRRNLSGGFRVPPCPSAAIGSKRQANALTIDVSSILILIVSALAAAAGFFLRKPAHRKPAKAEAASPPKNRTWTKTLGALLMILGVWVFAVRLLRLAAGLETVSPAVWFWRSSIFGVGVSNTVIIGWGILGFLIFWAVLGRLLAVPRMEEIPRGAQAFLEAITLLLDKIGYAARFPKRVAGAMHQRSAQRKLAAAAKSAEPAAKPEREPKAPRRLHPVVSALLIAAAWAAARILLSFAGGTGRPSFWALRTQLFGTSVNNTVLFGLILLFLLLLLAILSRLLVVPGMREMRNTHGAQTAVGFTAALIFWLEWIFSSPARARRAARSRAASKKAAEQAQPAGPKTPRWTFSGFVQFITKAPKGKRLVQLFAFSALAILLWVIVVNVLTRLFGSNRGEEFSVSLWPERIPIWNIEVSSTVLLVWVVMAGLFILALLARILVISRMREDPRGVQNLLELAVDGIARYTKENTTGIGDNLGAYIFSVTALLVGCAIVELFGLRPPTTDITFTLALAIITFILINFYGLARKGLIGRVKSLGSPYPFVFPIRIITDLAIPISLSCRLFGNMLGGMIVVDLIRSALGNGAVGIISVLGLFFNVFHPLIQAFIFITLSLTFINEAVE